MKYLYVSLLTTLLAWPLLAEQTAVKRPANPAPSVAPKVPAVATDAALPPPAPTAKTVEYDDSDIIEIHTKLRHTTLIVLPKSERILDITCGDKEFWAVDGTENFAYVKPAKPNAQTNVNLITASGNVYSFVLSEISATPDVPPDLKVFIEMKDTSLLRTAAGAPKFVSSQEIDQYREEAEAAKAETRQTKESAQAAIDQGISEFVTHVRFPYAFSAGKKPFGVRAMYHDDKFTYIQARPEETPALYELKDGKPNFVTFDYKNGVYIVGKILDDGYLQIGKEKLRFKREE